jgi:hypothetical protein
MKTLFQEDLLDAGYELPTSGLCYNLDPEDAKALISEGEWLLAEDELIAREGESQQYLYMIVSGSVELSKRDDRGKQQTIADLGTGETFGEVAFLRGHIASATSGDAWSVYPLEDGSRATTFLYRKSRNHCRTALLKLSWSTG